MTRCPRGGAARRCGQLDPSALNGCGSALTASRTLTATLKVSVVKDRADVELATRGVAIQEADRYRSAEPLRAGEFDDLLERRELATCSPAPNRRRRYCRSLGHSPSLSSTCIRSIEQGKAEPLVDEGCGGGGKSCRRP